MPFLTPNRFRGPLTSLRILSALRVSALALFFFIPFASAQNVLAHLGFDRNQYPGDAAMKILRKDFAFTGYWLSPPPGEKTNTWTGKRDYLRSLGYGFLLLANGRESREFKSRDDAAAKGAADAKAAAASAKQEHFAAGALIFADIEEGGRLIPAYHTYLKAWAEALRSDGFRPGAYCSGISVDEGGDVIITTAADIHFDPNLQDFTLFVYNDECPPSPGCSVQAHPKSANGNIGYAAVWQFAQSPRRKRYTAHCPAKYAKDGNCYAPSDTAHKWFLDLNSATSPDPSNGAK